MALEIDCIVHWARCHADAFCLVDLGKPLTTQDCKKYSGKNYNTKKWVFPIHWTFNTLWGKQKFSCLDISLPATAFDSAPVYVTINLWQGAASDGLQWYVPEACEPLPSLLIRLGEMGRKLMNLTGVWLEKSKDKNLTF